MRIAIEIEDEKDANLIISLAKRLKGKILEESVQSKKSKAVYPIASLGTTSKRGKIRSISDTSGWQKTVGQDRNFFNSFEL